MTADLLALLERQRPDLSPAEREALVASTPDRERVKPPQKPVSARCGSRPRTAASLERRRSWAAAGWMPPALACRFTVAEVAVLAVVAEQVATRAERPAGGTFQTCELPMDAIAAVAGVCRTTVRNAFKQARTLGLIAVEERRLSAWRNLPHRITVVSPEWLAWLKLRTSRRRDASGGGRKSVQATSTKDIGRGFRREEAAQAPGQAHPDKAQASPWPNTPEGSRIRDRSRVRVAEGSARDSTKGGLSGVQRRGMYGNARLRGA